MYFTQMCSFLKKKQQKVKKKEKESKKHAFYSKLLLHVY